MVNTTTGRLKYEGEAQVPAPTVKDLIGFDQEMFVEKTPTDGDLFDKAELDNSMRNIVRSQEGGRLSDVI